MCDFLQKHRLSAFCLELCRIICDRDGLLLYNHSDNFIDIKSILEYVQKEIRELGLESGVHSKANTFKFC